MSTSFPEEVKRQVKGRYVMVTKDKYEFLNTEDKNVTEEAHHKWFHAFWWIKPEGITYFDTKAEAIEGGLSFGEKPRNWHFWWIVYDSEANFIDGGF